MKKFFLLATLFLPLAAQADESTQENKDVIFLWDLHYVVIKPRGAFRAVLKYPHKLMVLKNKRLQRKIWKLLFKGMFKESASDQFIHLADKYNNPHLKELIIQASNSQKPIAQTVAIIKELADNGYTHHVGSNIGLNAFQALTDPDKFPQYELIFKHFDLERSHVVAYNQGNTVKKPNPEFFHQYLVKNNIDLTKTRIIFIDDKKNNIETARSLGFDTVKFKNAAQLRKDLAAMGIKIQT